MATKRIRVATTYQSDKDIDRLRREVDSLILQLNDVLQRLDHGDIAGLDDDDHEQYHNDDRGDARYFREDEHIDVSAGAGDAGKPIVLDVDGKIDASMIDYTDVTDDILSNSIPAVSLASSGGSGSAEEASRSDHRHQVSTATAVSVGTANAVGTSSALARADHTHAVTGLSIASQASGDMIYYNGSVWIRRSIGTEGYVLTSVSGFPGWSTPVPVGTMVVYKDMTVPQRWLECDGSAVNRTTYAGLFAVLGTTFGAGDGSTTFNLPNPGSILANTIWIIYSGVT